MESDYYKELSQADKTVYLSKLTLQNEKRLPDPFTIKDNNWSDDISMLPDMTYIDLFQYLVNTPSPFTMENLKAYKSLEAYNFYLSGHVQDVFIHQIQESSYFYIKSEVLPSQRQGQKQQLYKVWIAVQETGWILTGNCTCMAG